ncbi:MAG: YgfZ/GcvT domain-containing protein [Terriglobales bacterium]
MSRTPLYDQLVASGGRMSEYLGVEQASSFGDARREYVELRSGCGVYDLGWRSKLVLTGSDRTRWLNGMVTNNIRDLALNHGNYNFLLNAQGRILGDLYAYNRGDYILIDTAAWQAPAVKETFEKFIIMDDVEVTDASDKITSLAVQGPRAREILLDAGVNFADVDPMQVQDVAWNDAGISVTRMISDVARTYEIWLTPAAAPSLWEALVRAGAKPVGTEALEMFRVAAGVPRYGQDITQRYLPQETAQDSALNFSKGCYVGQEIVERIRSRALLHRSFIGIIIDGPAPSSGAKVQLDGKDVGEITSAVTVPAGDRDLTLALGYLRTEAQAPGAELRAEESRARATQIPFREVGGPP